MNKTEHDALIILKKMAISGKYITTVGIEFICKTFDNNAEKIGEFFIEVVRGKLKHDREG